MYSIGIDLGGTNIAVGLCDSSLRMLDKASTRTLAYRGGEPIVKDMASLARTVMERNSLTIADITFVCIATPGIANEETGVVEHCYNLPFVDFSIVELFKKYFSIERVLISNDATPRHSGRHLPARQRGRKAP